MKIFDKHSPDGNVVKQFEKLFKYGFYGLIIFIFLPFILFLFLLYRDGYFSMELCSTRLCFERLGEPFIFSYKIFESYVEIIYMLSTSAGIYFAVKGYFFNKNSTNVYNHVELVRMFSLFLESEVSKKRMLSIDSFNSIKFYNYVFPDSRFGMCFVVSTDFISFVKEVNSLIDKNNKKVFSTKEDSFRYMEHQRSLTNMLIPLGISLEMFPRSEFNELEIQLYEILNSIVSEFSDIDIKINLKNIEYM